MMPGMNSRQAKAMMKKMGIQQQDLDAKEVIIRLEDREIIIRNPEVAKVNMMGQETYQVVGQAEERSLDTTPEISEEDIQTVVDQCGCSKKEARVAIEEAKGDLAEAILELKK
ncbi:MAG: nascent polypeptide-associated complex protein [archaeon]